MRHVPSITVEDPLMIAYRDGNPADAAAGPQMARSVWDRFKSDAAYAAVRGQLVTLQQGLCGYCEQRLTDSKGALIGFDQQIEHVLAKAGGAGRTLDSFNFMLCCSGGSYREKDRRYYDKVRHYDNEPNVSCGQSKGEEDLGAGCDPRRFPRRDRMVDVAIDGRLQVNEGACRAAGIDPGALKSAIDDRLNLNCERLRLARQAVVKNLLEWLVLLLEEPLKDAHLDAEQAMTVRRLFVEGRLGPDAHGHLRAFWTTERCYLEP